MDFAIYKKHPWPLNLWSTVFGREITLQELPSDWEAALEHIYTTLGAVERKEAIEGYYHQGKTWQEIADVSGTSYETIRQRAGKAIRRMRWPSRRIFLEHGFAAGKRILSEIEPKAEPDADINSVHSLMLSTRAQFCLCRAHITTLNQLTAKTEKDILGIRNMGIKTLREIKARLAERGLSLSEEEGM